MSAVSLANPSISRSCRANAFGSRRMARTTGVRVMAARTTYKVEVEHAGKTIELMVPEGQTILNAALDKKIQLPHDCNLGVCCKCPAKLISGTVDASAGMASDDVAEKGYTLLCVATPTSDCKVVTCSEDEILDLQLNA
ncbi:hypothetical protein Agub_g3757 [Astrephomene gubernaculifera]|uniref:2Fe-2S ferredoxin-type domain-containing protein n=1 Tax=Astrephomene gubernaculifera TaxID=47775 RepID=A0AAD3DJP8_9CHLO|nr:hypothetical protein Agub_g3757 [Astrephomene gubernaculifera]